MYLVNGRGKSVTNDKNVTNGYLLVTDQLQLGQQTDATGGINPRLPKPNNLDE